MFPLLSKLKFLRGTPLDPFGRTSERCMERDLIVEYRAHIERELALLNSHTLERALAVARVPESIRGYGHVKAASVVAARAKWSSLLAEATMSVEMVDVL